MNSAAGTVSTPTTQPEAQAEEEGGAPAPLESPAGLSPAGLSRGAVDRRLGTRRTPKADRAFIPPVPPFSANHWLPARWPWMMLVLLLAIAGCLLTASQMPERDAGLALSAAVLLLLPVGQVRRLIETRPVWLRLVAASLFVAPPLFLFGFALSRWAQSGGLAWDVALAALLLVSGIAAGHLRRQPGLVFAAQLAVWMAVVVQLGSVAGFAAFGLAIVVVAMISREQFAEQKAEAEYRDAEERVQTRARDILSDYEETGQGWFWETDRRSLLTYISVPAAKALGKRAEDLIGQPLTSLFAMEQSGKEGERSLMFHMSARSSFSELAMRAATGEEERWWSVSGRPIHDQFDNFVGFRGSGTDLTEKRRSQEDASRLARYDSLTGLANRFQMSQSLEKILGSPQVSNRHCAIMLLDLDRFKHVNDTLGHPAGDALLKQVARRLERAVGPLGQVGRLGGDEFKVVVPNRVDREVLTNVGAEIIHSLSQPYSIEGQRVVIGASIGIALSPEHGTNSEELIRNADLALYAAKDGGRGRFHFFTEELHADAEARARLEEDLRDAITQGQLQLYYQPVVATASERITGFEALLRWEHPEKGWISPARFVAIAEDSGLIAEIGEWALRQACQDLAQWPEEVRVAVNVSPLQFSNPNLPSVVMNAIANAGIAPSRLELEITESVFLSDDAGTDAMFASLKRIGVRLALDDFGTGYSSLGYLKKAPFDKIKIDQSFVRGATEEGSRNGAIIASITSLAQALGMDTTAEGVETHDELELVRMHGCSHVQGYIYERPLSAENASTRLASGLSAVARGPRSARSPRQKMLRKVVLDHHGQLYNGTIRNISASGALIEGLWNVPVGTVFSIRLSQHDIIPCITRWCEEDRMGVEFDEALVRDDAGRIKVAQADAPDPVARNDLRRTA